MLDIHGLPVELLVMLLIYLDYKGVSSFRRTCKGFNTITLAFFMEMFLTVRHCRLTPKGLKALLEISQHPEFRGHVRHIWIHHNGSGTQLPGINYPDFFRQLKTIFDGLPNLVGIGPVRQGSPPDRLLPPYLTPFSKRQLDDPGGAFGSPPVEGEESDPVEPTAFASTILMAAVDSGKELIHMSFDGPIAPELLNLSRSHWERLPNTFVALTDLIMTIHPLCNTFEESGRYLTWFLEAALNVERLDLTVPYEFEDSQSLDETIQAWRQILAARFRRLECLRLKNVVADTGAVASFIQPSVSTIINLDIDVTSTVEELVDATASWKQLIENALESAPRLQYARISFPCETLDESWARRDTITWAREKGLTVDTWWHEFDESLSQDFDSLSTNQDLVSDANSDVSMDSDMFDVNTTETMEDDNMTETTKEDPYTAIWRFISPVDVRYDAKAWVIQAEKNVSTSGRTHHRSCYTYED